MRLYHRNAAIFAGIFTLLQGCVWVFLAIWGVGVYACTFDYPYYTNSANTVGNLYYYSYFIGRCRNDREIPEVGEQPPRTYSFLLTYGIISAVSIPTSILLLIAAVNKIHGKVGARCYYPWLITTAALLVLDVVATSIYGMDIGYTMTPQDYRASFRYVPDVRTRDLEGLTVVPAVIMTVVFCRAIFIWIINLVVFGVVIQAIVGLNKRPPTAEFVEKEARIKTERAVTPSSWVHMGRRSNGSPVEQVGQPRPRRGPRTYVRSDFKTDDRRPVEVDRFVVQSPTEDRDRPGLKPLPIKTPTIPPPPPPLESSSPFFDVYGKPTTPDSPQPAFVRPNSYNQMDRTEVVNRDIPWSYVNPQHRPPPAIPAKPIPEQDYNGQRAIPEPDYTLHRAPPPRRPAYLGPLTEDTEVLPPAKRFENNPNVWKVM